MPGLVGSLLGLGNPLLDVIADVDQAYLDKYELKLGNQILAEEKHQPMFKELSSQSKTQYVPGGATQNSIRVAQWMLQVPGASSYFGCVGSDNFGNIMKQTAQDGGVNVQYLVDENTPSGTCATCINSGDRSLVANLASANNYKVDHLKKPEQWKVVEQAQVIYSAGFFITVSPESIALTAKHCAEHNKIYCMNISAPFLCQVPPFKKSLLDTMPFIDFLFGNETEAQAFAESEGWSERSIPAIALKISQFPKHSGVRPRVVVITQGSDPTVVSQCGQVRQYPVIPLAKEKLVDTNGAGDAFVGGFLSQLVAGKDIPECVRAGAYAAHIVIQQSGCTFPAVPEGFSWS
ncbi:hypothetical protein WJX73_001708 [Symbiochloris irregularis]|uniref:Adenosine kinase n=1 Tax=Symbiochloris irregularis TaxID=706552 RepID=A0AAW1P948_9CHLO